MRKRSPGRPSHQTSTPASSGPIAYPRLPPTTKYEVSRPRFSAEHNRLTSVRAAGWKQACPSAARIAKSHDQVIVPGNTHQGNENGTDEKTDR